MTSKWPGTWPRTRREGAAGRIPALGSLPAAQGRSRAPRRVERLTSADVTQLTTDVGPVPMQIGACLLLDAGPGFDPSAVRRCIAARIPAVPRLRQRLARLPPGCGRPVWVDDAAFDVRHHFQERRCPRPGDDNALLGAAFRLLAALGVFRWYINHQHFVHTFITNIRGPSRALALGGATISAVIPVMATPGNVTISFAVLSYAGTLTVTVITDPDRLPSPDVLIGALRQELGGMH